MFTVIYTISPTQTTQTIFAIRQSAELSKKRMCGHQKHDKSMDILSAIDFLIFALPEGFFVLRGCLTEYEGRQSHATHE